MDNASVRQSKKKAAARFDRLTRVSGDAPMGKLMRQYWVPVLHSNRLVPDGAPVRLRILGEDLVAFRGSDGKACIIAEQCPHRGVSMALARNEDCGLRCVMHGWKIDTSGRLVEAPNLGPKAKLDRVATGHRPTLEDGGIVWGWFADDRAAPAPPQHAFSQLPAGHVTGIVATLQCNWLQPLETLWDPYHVSWLHKGTIDNANAATGNAGGYFANGMPTTEMKPTAYGFHYVSRSPDGLVQGVPFVMPWYSHHVLEPGAAPDCIAFAHVPVDDDHTLLWAIVYNPERPLRENGGGLALARSFPAAVDYRGDYTWANMWRQDRARMRAGQSFSGIGAGLGHFGIFLEDYAACESMGAIVDRGREHLGVTDAVIVKARALLLKSVAAFEKGGSAPGAGRNLRSALPTVARS